MKKFETVAPKIVRQMREQGSSISHAVRQYLELMATKRTRSVLAPLHGIDFDREIPAFAAWVEQSLAHGAMPDSIAGLWFYVPEFMMNEPRVYFVGSKEFSLEDADWASDTDWTQDATGRAGRATPSDHPPEFDSAVLREVLAAIGCDESDESPFEQDEQLGEELFFTTTGLAQVYVGCLLHVALPKIAPSLACGGRAWRGVGYGIASGDLQYAGVVGPGGWLNKTRAKRVTAKEPDSYSPSPNHGRRFFTISNAQWRVHCLHHSDLPTLEAIRGFRPLAGNTPPPLLPIPTQLRLESDSRQPRGDFAASSLVPPVVSARFRQILDSFTREITWYPVDLMHDGLKLHGEFWAMAIRPLLSFHDEIHTTRAGPRATDLLLGIVMDPRKVPLHLNVFAHVERPEQLFVSGAVVEALRRDGVTGFQASPVRVVHSARGHR